MQMQRAERETLEQLQAKVAFDYADASVDIRIVALAIRMGMCRIQRISRKLDQRC